MEITTDRAGISEDGIEIPTGTKCEYLCHVPGGMVKVRLENGDEEIVHPHIYKELR